VKEATPLSHGFEAPPPKSPLKAKLLEQSTLSTEAVQQSSKGSNDISQATVNHGGHQPQSSLIDPLTSLRAPQPDSLNPNSNEVVSMDRPTSQTEDSTTQPDQLDPGELPGPGFTRSLLAKFQSMLKSKK